MKYLMKLVSFFVFVFLILFIVKLAVKLPKTEPSKTMAARETPRVDLNTNASGNRTSGCC